MSRESLRGKPRTTKGERVSAVCKPTEGADNESTVLAREQMGLSAREAPQAV